MVAVCEWMKIASRQGRGGGRRLRLRAVPGSLGRTDFPKSELTGIDPCPALLDRLPASVRRHEGTLLRTNLPEATFDGAFAVESLEHCLVAKRGIAELCRIVRARRTACW